MIAADDSSSPAADPPPVRPGTAARWLPGALGVLALGGYVAAAGAGLGPDPVVTFAENWLPTVTSCLALAMLLWRLAVDRTHRGPWLVMGVGMTLWIAADFTWAFLGFPAVSVADAFYLAFYVAAWAAIALLVRNVAGRAGVSAWLDGLVAALCVAAAAAIFLFPAVSGAGGDTVEVIVNFAYPVADVLLLSAALVATSLTGWRPQGALAVLIVAVLLQSIGDVVYLYQVAVDQEPVPAWLIQVAWSLSMLVMGASAWCTDHVGAPRQKSWVALAGPAVFAAASLGLLTTMARDSGHTVGALLAAGALMVLLVRMGLYFREVTHLSSGLAHAQDAARHDALTGLLNHGAFHHAADEAIERANRLGRPLSLVLLDLDHFKRVNDDFGHAAGDRALRHVARTLARAGRDDDPVGRIGGEELAWLLPGARFEEAQAAAERLRAAVSGEPIDGVGFLTASIGVVTLCPGERAAVLFDRADSALYAAKDAGRNTVVAHHVPGAEALAA